MFVNCNHLKFVIL